MAVFVIFTLLFLGMGVRLVTLQIIEAPRFTALAANQRERVIEFPARRGAIFDRNGESLAVSLDYSMIFTDPAHVEDVAAAAEALAPILKVPVSELAFRLSGTFEDDRFEYLARQVPPDVVKKVKALKIPGIYFESEPKRYYPGDRLAAHVLGHVNLDGTPFGGVEGAYNRILEGEPGQMMLEQDPAGRMLPQAAYSQTRAQPGQSLLLTIDKEIQYFTEHALVEAVGRYSASAGSAIVMRVGTGEILAMANVPSFDPNRAGEFDQAALRNRAVTDMYEPGSAFKIVTASAALEEGVVKPKTQFTVGDNIQIADRVINDSHGHATERMTVSEIIEQSSNVGTIQIGLKLGGRKLDRYMKRFGFGKPTGLDFPGEAPGIMLPRKDWSGSTIGTLPIGQGVAVTPLQMTAAYQAIANDGIWVEPKLLYSTMSPLGEIETASPPTTKRIVSHKTARQMRKILTRVVKQGTGLEAQIPGYQVAGKTGTAQKPAPGGGYGSTYVGSFGGFAPASRPEIVVFVMLDEPSPIWGGSTAAPTFRTISEFVLRHLGVSPTGDAEKAAKEIESSTTQNEPTYD